MRPPRTKIIDCASFDVQHLSPEALGALERLWIDQEKEC